MCGTGGSVSGGAGPGMAGVDRAKWSVGTVGNEEAVVQKQLQDKTKNPAGSFSHRYLFR